jgi:beta-lactamase superfamily II metal-dependent hydrolase
MHFNEVCIRWRSRLACLLVAGLMPTAPLATAQTLDIYFIDVEGGEATLIVTPDRRAMLIDTGWDGFNNRDPERIVAAARDARIDRLDYLLITHFHRDHAGGAPEVVRRRCRLPRMPPFAALVATAVRRLARPSLLEPL